jgi:hypothetical protein
MKKIMGVLVMTLLIGTAILPIVSSENKSIDNNVIKELFIDEEYGCNSKKNDEYGFNKFFNHPGLNILPENILQNDIFSIPTIVDLPEYFNWMDYEGQDWTTSAKNQWYPNPCGSCFIQAPLGALETIINIREGIADLNPDLSEQYVLSCLPVAGSCDGGDPSSVYKFILKDTSLGNNCNGVIPEFCFPYQGDDEIPCDDKNENWMDFLIPITDWGNLYPDIDALKSKIMENGPIVLNICDNMNFSLWGYTHHDPDDYFPLEVVGLSDINHCVIIVGWKDDPSIGKGGYWICKNSYGPNFGYNGFFNLEYNSLGSNYTFITWASYNPDDYDWHPTPKANGPYYGLVNEPIGFQGETGGEHPPFTYYWDFGDSETSEEQNPSHIYTSPGEYIVTLTVTDSNNDAISDTTTSWIQETNTPPNTPTIEGPTKVKPEEYCWYNISTVDPDGSEFYIYDIVFDIEYTQWWGPFEPGEVDRWYWYWSEEGDYIVKAKAKDPYGAESEWATLQVTVPKNKEVINRPFLNFLQQHPNLFPILRQLLQKL